MNDLTWHEKYSIGVDEIDYQHKYFLKLVQKINTEAALEPYATYLARLIEELSLYAQFHFTSEENMMFKHSYPLLDAHADLHSQLIDSLNSFTYGMVHTPEKTDELLAFLQNWFFEHTAKEDQLFGAYLKQQNVIS